VDQGSTQRGPLWNASRLPGAPAIAVKPTSVGDADALRSLFRISHIFRGPSRFVG
jgi:hypothetical protein